MENPLKLKRIHHVEFYVGNAKQASFYYRNAFGFSQVAYSGLETGNRQATSYLLRQGKADILLTTPLDPNSPASEHIRRHGDGVRDIALHVEDADWRSRRPSGAAPSPRSNRTISSTSTEEFAAPPSRPTATRFTR